MGTSSSEKRNNGGLTMTYGIVARINMHNPPFELLMGFVWYKVIKNTFIAFQGFRFVPFKLSEVQRAKHDPWKTRYHVAKGLCNIPCGNLGCIVVAQFWGSPFIYNLS